MPLEINKPLLKSLLLMADIVEARDPYTGGHVWRVSQFAKLLATKAGMPEDDVVRVSVAAYLHDMGKVGIPDQILKKPEALSDDEYAVIKTHPSIGDRLLGGHPLADMVRAAAAEHHERVDGKGYPHGLQGDQLSPVSRIIAIADAFDAMTSMRPYRKGMPIEKALNILEENAGTQFDADLVRHMCALGQAGDLAHIVGHTADGIPAVVCPHCGPVIAIPCDTQDGDIVYCRACQGELQLRRVGDTFEAEMIGMTDDPRKLEPVPNEAGIASLMHQIG